MTNAQQVEFSNLLTNYNGKTTEQEKDKAIATAAGHIAGAVATAYFGPVAGVLVDEAVTAISGALLSADDDRFEKEIISRLTVIEQKIDLIINFFNTQFREVVADVLAQEKISELVAALKVDAIKMQSAIAVFQATRHPTATDAQTLVSAAEELLGTGYKLFERSKDRYLLAIPYFAVSMSALNVARKHHRQFDEVLGIWAGKYLDQIQPWLTQGLPNASSFQEIRTRTVNELLNSQGLLKDFVVGSPVIYLNLISEIFTFDPSYNTLDPSQPPRPMVFSGTIGYAAEYVLNSDFTVSVRDLKAYKVVQQRVGPGDNLDAIFGNQAHPTFPPMFGSAGLRNQPIYWNFYSGIYHAFGAAAVSLRDCPARRDALDFAIKVLQPFSLGLQALTVLGKHLD